MVVVILLAVIRWAVIHLAVVRLIILAVIGSYFEYFGYPKPLNTNGTFKN